MKYCFQDTRGESFLSLSMLGGSFGSKRRFYYEIGFSSYGIRFQNGFDVENWMLPSVQNISDPRLLVGGILH